MSSRIEAGITIEGSIRGEGELEVAGRIRGALTIAGKLTIEEGGIVEADVEANEIEVAGLLSGSATAHESVKVLEGGRVEARVRAPKMLVDEGAVFRGELQSPHDEDETPRALPAPGARAAKPRAKPAATKSAPTERAAKPAEKRTATRGRAPGFAPPVVSAARDATLMPPSPGNERLTEKQKAGVSTRRRKETPKMPTLPRGRTKIQRRGDES